jgi:poly-gamma-glutamate synthesis protein (capsule biosynthesis protein)
MDEKGNLYPSEKIGDLLRSADITHISNEIAFDPGCVLEGSGTKFCSKPQYFDLLKEIGTDVIELTGNHELDYGTQPFLYSLDLYAKNGIPYYGGGRDPAEAAQPLKVEINGNRIAFLGCNAVGPDEDLAQEGSPGSNPCDTGQLRISIQELRNEGYNPIVTFQHMEVCQAEPVGPQRGDFQRAAEAGAVIVSGSQGHCPQVMEFYGDVVIHYGLGNLFFDQMDKIERMAFVDRYWFYDNRLIGVEPIPIIRDDAAQPRQMTVEEARWFLKRYLPSLGGTK